MFRRGPLPQVFCFCFLFSMDEIRCSRGAGFLLLHCRVDGSFYFTLGWAVGAVLKDRTMQSGIGPCASEWESRGDKKNAGQPKDRGGIKCVYCKDEATEGKKRARENLCTQKHHYITRSKRYATLRHLTAPLSVPVGWVEF